MRRLLMGCAVRARRHSGFRSGQEGADRAARHGLVPRRRPPDRDHRPAGEGGRVHAGRRAGQGRPERQVPGRADVRAVLPAAEQEGKAAAAAVARRRPVRRHLRDQARRRADGWMQLLHPQRLGHLHVRRDGARPLRLDQHLQGRGRCSLPFGDPWERFRIGPIGSWNDDHGQARDLSGRAVSGRGLSRSS